MISTAVVIAPVQLGWGRCIYLVLPTATSEFGQLSHQNWLKGLIVEGAEAGTPIAVYDLSGRLITTTTAFENSTMVRVPINEKVVVKVGNKAVKVKR